MNETIIINLPLWFMVFIAIYFPVGSLISAYVSWNGVRTIRSEMKNTEKRIELAVKLERLKNDN